MKSWIWMVGLIATVGVASGAPDGSIVKPFISPTSQASSGSNSVAGPQGTLLVEKHGKRQEFAVKIKHVGQPAGGLGVFLGDTPSISDGAVFVNVLAAGGATNGNWSLILKNTNGGAVPFLGGVLDVNELVGKFVFIADSANNVSLRALITPLVTRPTSLSYSKLVHLTAPQPVPSPRATGLIRTRYNGATGGSLLEIRVRRLAAGNTYCCVFTWSSTPPTSVDCSGGNDNFQGQGVVRFDTKKGEDLPGGLATGVTTIEDLAGMNIFVVDPFGIVHLQGTIPSAPRRSVTGRPSTAAVVAEF